MEYGGQGTGRTILTFGPPVQGAVKVMMIVCAVTTLLLNAKPDLLSIFALSSGSFYPWQIFTSTFCHFNIMHVAFNCFGLWIFGGQLENFWGTRKFLTFFIITSTSANLLWLIWAWFFPSSGFSLMFGGSGGIFALLYAYAYFWPDNTMLAFWLFPVRAKVFVFMLAFLDLFFFGIVSNGTEGNVLVRLSAMLVAAIWLDYTCNGKGISWLSIKYADFIFKRKTRHLTVISGTGSGEKSEKPSNENRPRIIN
jgi:membrane associated rhomboid family serine protease